jgi:tetratricopeptide (TPR) repeat protein
MLATKNRFRCGAMISLALVLFIAGCTPPGPRALLKGKKLLERGDYAAAMAQLQVATATPVLATNAQAWNYLGVACQGAGQTADAVTAYQRALTLNRDLMEAHYNLGSLWLEQNKFDAAKTEFIAYTLRRANAPEGWLKLGDVQLRVGDLASAEKSFGTAYYLNTNNAEALNGLGLVQVKRGHPREASQFFGAAVQYHPDYAPALLNQAAVAQENLHDNALALESYRKYLALKPRPANWDEVNAIVNDLGKPTVVASAAPLPASAPAIQPRPVTPAPPSASEIKTQKVTAVHSPASSKTKPVSSTPPSTTRPSYNPPPRSPTMQVVEVSSEPVIYTTPRPAQPAPATTTNDKPGVLRKMNPLNWFGSTGAQPDKYGESGVTPLPAPDQKPIKVLPAAPPVFPRYLYLSPRKPAAGDHVAAMAAFNKAREYEQSSRWTEALEDYRRATVADAGWFEARYNYGVLAHRLRNYDAALSAYETALAIQPDSVDARYNFALTLKAAGYAVDAVNELEKISAVKPGEVRAQLALGNLYAYQLRDPARARLHYLKVLGLDPGNPQAANIHDWLVANPPSN